MAIFILVCNVLRAAGCMKRGLGGCRRPGGGGVSGK